MVHTVKQICEKQKRCTVHMLVEIFPNMKLPYVLLSSLKGFTEFQHVLVSLVHVCDELLQKRISKAFLYGWRVKLLLLYSPVE